MFEHPPFASPRPLCLRAKNRLCCTLSSEMVELISYVDSVADPGGIQGCKGTSLFSGVLSPSRRSRRRSLRGGEILRVLQNV